MARQPLLLVCALLAALPASASSHAHTSVLMLRGGASDKGRKAIVVAAKPKLPALPSLEKFVDTALAGVRASFNAKESSPCLWRLGLAAFVHSRERSNLVQLGLAGSFALLGALEPKLGIKLFVPPMMASGLIFFSPATPPSPRGFLVGTIGCASISAALLSLLSGVVTPVAAQGCAAGALLVWYKATGCIFPPAAVLCVLMAGVPLGTSVASWVAAPWVAGHACLYASAYGVGALRMQARQKIYRKRLQSLSTLSKDELRAVFKRFDTSKDGSLDAVELKMALRVALHSDLSLQECQKLIERADIDGTNSLDFGEFQNIVTSKSK